MLLAESRHLAEAEAGGGYGPRLIPTKTPLPPPVWVDALEAQQGANSSTSTRTLRDEEFYCPSATARREVVSGEW